MALSRLSLSVAVLISLACSASIPSRSLALAKRDACSNGPWAGPYRIGGDGTTGGSPYCETKTNPGLTNAIVTSLKMYIWDGWGINGIEFQYSDGYTILHGGRTESEQSITLASNERVTGLSLYGDGTGDHLGYIYMETDKGQTFQGGKDMDSDEYKIDVGGGIILGAYGYADDTEGGIYNTAFLFLEAEIDHIEVGHLNLDPSPVGTNDGLQAVSLLDTYMGNEPDQKHPITVTAILSQAETESVSHEQSTTGSFGMHADVEVSGEILGVGAKVTAGYEWSVEHSETTKMETSNTITLRNDIQATVDPGHGVHCWMAVHKGQGSFPYTSDVTLYLKNGDTYSYSEKGTMKAVAYSRVDGSCDRDDDRAKWKGNQDSPPSGLQVKKLAGYAGKPTSSAEKPQGTGKPPQGTGKPPQGTGKPSQGFATATARNSGRPLPTGTGTGKLKCTKGNKKQSNGNLNQWDNCLPGPASPLRLGLPPPAPTPTKRQFDPLFL